MKNMDFSDVSVVMASRNEERAVGKVIKEIKKYTKGMAEVILVDSSSDKTAEIARKLGAKVIRQHAKGYGAATKRALLSAAQDIIITLDCDATYPANKIPDLMQLINKGYDIVSCSRFKGRIKNMRKLNVAGNMLFSILASLLYCKRITDTTTGMRAYKRHVISSIAWGEDAGLSAELLLKPIAKGFRFIEIPIDYRKRVGKTKLNAFTGGFEILAAIIKSRFS